MYHTTSVIPEDGDRVDVRLNRRERTFPVISIGDLTIQLPSRMGAEGHASWLRDLAHKCESLAEVIEAGEVATFTYSLCAERKSTADEGPTGSDGSRWCQDCAAAAEAVTA